MATRLGWIVEGLRTGIVTTPYPHRDDPTATDGLRTRPLLRPERCLASAGCEACVQICLPHALALEPHSEPSTTSGSADRPNLAMQTLWLDLGRCIGCGLCAAACPANALVMANDAELAAQEPPALRQAAPLASADRGVGAVPRGGE